LVGSTTVRGDTCFEFDPRCGPCVISLVAVVSPNDVESASIWPRRIPSMVSWRGCQSAP
jgi:hypothetical protein